MVLVAVAILLGAALQSAAGFGFALVAGPALFVVFEPSEALTQLLVLAAGLNALMLFAERRPRRILWPALGTLLVAAVPGLLAGALVLRVVPKPELQVVVGLAVMAAALLQARDRVAAGQNGFTPSRAAAVGAGVTTGVLTTTTNTNGPPLVLWLQRLGAAPAELRDSVAAALLPLNAAGAVTVALLGGRDVGEPALDLGTLAVLAVLTAAGHLAGRRVFEGLDPRRFRAVGLVLVVLAGAGSVAAGLRG